MNWYVYSAQHRAGVGEKQLPSPSALHRCQLMKVSAAQAFIPLFLGLYQNTAEMLKHM